MRLILRFALLAVIVGAVLGLLLRPVLKRRRFGLLCVLSLAPVLVHALYLGWVSWQGGALPAALVPFGLATLALLVAMAVLARRLVTSQPLLAAFTPAAAGLVYALIASLMWSFGLSSVDVVPNAVAGAAAGLASLALVATLLVFVPQTSDMRGRMRMPWQRP